MTQRLLRLTLFHTRPMPSLRSPHVRIGSPDAGLLDLDDLGAELAERGADHRTRGERGGLDDAQAVRAGRPAVSHGALTAGRARPRCSRRVEPV